MHMRVIATLVLGLLAGGLLASSAGAQTTSALTTSSIIVKVVAGLTTDAEAAIVARNGGALTSAIPALRLLVVSVPIDDLAAALARYQADAQVQSVEENKVRVSESVPSDLLYANQWALPKIAWDQVFGVVTPTGSAKVALLDTGVDAAHPELADKVVSGTSILDGSNGMTDPSGHGTWLAGIIAGQTNTIPGDGIAGVGYAGVKILPVTVLNANGEGQDSDVIAGVIWAADHGADVILMAFSNPGFSANLQDAIDYAWSKNAVVVAAVGNNASSEATFPAGDRGVMGVAATDQSDALASFSNGGQTVFIAAPGVDIQTIDIGDGYTVISGTSTAAAIVAGSAALIKAVNPTLTNGIIVGRLARNADPAGVQAETGNGRVNLARALQDTSMEPVQPAGAPPTGTGGPFVGPYIATNLKFLATLAIISPAGAIDKSVNRSQSFTVQVTITNNNNNVDQSRTYSSVSATLTVPAGWSKSANLLGATLGTATAGGSSPCGGAVTTSSCTFVWTVTAPNSTSNGNEISAFVSGIPSGINDCSGGGNSCSDNPKINGIAVVNPAAITITSFTARDSSAPAVPGTDVIVRAGQSVALALTVANTAPAPGATANGVAASGATVMPAGTATATCGAASAAENILTGGSHVYSYTCGTISGDGTLKFSASATGTDDNTGATLTAGPNDSNVITVDSTTPTSGLTPASGTVLAPFSFSWNITDPTVNGVSSGLVPGTCSVTVGASVVSTACSGTHSLGGGNHHVVVSASDVAGNTLSDSRDYNVIVDVTAPVVVLTFVAPITGLNGFYNAADTVPVVGTVTADDTTTGGSNVTDMQCTGVGVTIGAKTGLGTSSASAPVTVSGDGTHDVTCTATDSAGNTGAGPGSTNTAVIKIDTVAPDTSITSNPSNPSNSTAATFNFTGTDPSPSSGGPTFECRLDGEGFAACTSPRTFTGLTDGSHTFDVRARDAAGNVDPTPASFTWLIDTQPPQVTVTFSTPTGLAGWFVNVTVSGSVTAADASNVTAINCTDTASGLVLGALVNGGTPAASRTVTVSGEGTHDVTCTATDGAGNTGVAAGSSNTATVKIDSVAPDTTITSTPANPTNNTSASFSFTGADPAPSSGGPTFECMRDSGSFTACASPKSFVGLTDGSHTFQVRAKDTAGNVDASPASFTWVVDTQPPQVIVAFPAPDGMAGWFRTSPVVGSVTATDPTNVTAIHCTDSAGGLIQGIITGGGTVTASRVLTVSGDGTHLISCTATDGAGNTGAASGSTPNATLKIDTVAPTVTLNAAANSCSHPGNSGWCRGTQTAGFAASDTTSGVTSPCSGASCSFTQSSATNGSAVLIASGTVCDQAGNCNTGISSGPFMIDSVAPSISITAPANGGVYLLNQLVGSSYSCWDATSGPNTCVGPVVSGANFDTTSVGPKVFNVDATDVAGNSATLTHSYAVQFAPAGQLCLGSPGHAILQPINGDGTSVFKQKSTIPAKFRVCDATGTSVGTPGVVTAFNLIQRISGTMTTAVNEAVDSTTPDEAFRWDPAAQQWIFNVNTKNLLANWTYVYRVLLADGTYIDFAFGLK